MKRPHDGAAAPRAIFVEDEPIPLWGWWFKIDQFGRYTMRLENTGKTKGLNQRIPALGETVVLKDIEFVVAHLDVDGVVLAVVPPTPDGKPTSTEGGPGSREAISVVNEHGDPTGKPTLH